MNSVQSVAIPTASPTLPPNPRGQYLQETTTAIAAALIDQMLAELQAPPPARSTGSAGLRERALMAALRPLVPQLRQLLLSRLSAGDPEYLEMIAGAIATAIEDVLAAAPGEPLPRFRAGWDAERHLVLTPRNGALEASATDA